MEQAEGHPPLGGRVKPLFKEIEMGKFDGILFCTDLDGTLLKNDKTISAQNKEAIEFFKREGGLFTFVTGRMPYYSLEAYRAVAPNAPFGCVNGSGVYDGEARQYVWTLELQKSAMELVSCIDERVPGVGIQIVAFEKTFFLKENRTTEIFRRLTGVPNVTCTYDSLPSSIAKVVFCVEREEEIGAIEETLKAHPLALDFQFVRSERMLCEILPKGIHKGVALAKLAEHLGIDKAKTIAIGDYDNDVGMLQTAGLGIAVSNASKAALAAADLVTVSNEEHALAKVIYDLYHGDIVL